MTKDRGCVGGVELRGQTYYIRMRVPARYRDVETRVEVNQSLKTRDHDVAWVKCHLRRKELAMEWEAKLAESNGDESPVAYDLAMELLNEIGVPYRPMADLLGGPVRDLLDRIEVAATKGPNAPQVPAMLGALEYPRVMFSEMPAVIEEISAATIAGKNPRQLRGWRAKYDHAARSFAELVGDKPVLDVSEADAVAYRRHWKDRVDLREISANHAAKRLRFARQLIDAYYERFDISPSQRMNPFANLKIEGVALVDDLNTKKISLPVPWVQRTLIEQRGLDGLNQEARDIATIAAECGCRQSEIYDLPPDDIRLSHNIPHVLLRAVTTGESRRQIKNRASERPVVLLGAALQAMQRHRTGFPRYRGKGSYSGVVNKYLRDRRLFPEMPVGVEGRYTLGCTRHTFEDRMLHAKLSNEERAFLMGHSVAKVRGRPVYGFGPDLMMRALYQEMVSYPTCDWHPRPICELREELDRVAEEVGFRVR